MEHRLVRALRRQPLERPPVWFMRQAGRFLPAYRALRKKHSILEMCREPELAAAAAMTAVDALPGLDGAIIFSDILQILIPMGIEVTFVEGEGPRLQGDPGRLRPIEPERDLRGPIEGIRILRREVGDQMAVLGFAGAPFTLASYVIEGGPSKNYEKTKAAMTGPGWEPLMDRLSAAITLHLNTQVVAGAHAVQLFDSWVGCLSPEDYRDHVLPWNRRILASVKGAPVIHFSTGTNGYLELVASAGGDAVGVDWRMDLAQAWSRLAPTQAIQGNLDPVALLGDTGVLLKKVDAILDLAAGRPGHVFNLGHGILPPTPIDNVLAVIERVKSRR